MLFHADVMLYTYIMLTVKIRVTDKFLCYVLILYHIVSHSYHFAYGFLITFRQCNQMLDVDFIMLHVR